jgi:hypothetical protein
MALMQANRGQSRLVALGVMAMLGLGAALAAGQGLEDFEAMVDAGNRRIDVTWHATPEVEDSLFAGYEVWRSQSQDPAAFKLLRRFERRYPVTWTFCPSGDFPLCEPVTADTLRRFADADSIVRLIKIEITAQGDSAMTREYVGIPPHNGFPYYYSVTWFSECLSFRNDTLWSRHPEPEFFDGFVGGDGDSLYRFMGVDGDTLLAKRVPCWKIDRLTGAMDPDSILVHSFQPAAEATDGARLVSIDAVRTVEPIFPTTVAQTTLQQVRAIPNPYDQRASWDEPDRRKIQFINLTDRATVRIYTAGGDLVRVLDHPAPGAESGLGSVDWDLKNGAGNMVKPGIYIFHAESPDHLVDTTGRLIIVY